MDSSHSSIPGLVLDLSKAPWATPGEEFVVVPSEMHGPWGKSLCIIGLLWTFWVSQSSLNYVTICNSYLPPWSVKRHVPVYPIISNLQ